METRVVEQIVHNYLLDNLKFEMERNYAIDMNCDDTINFKVTLKDDVIFEELVSVSG